MKKLSATLFFLSTCGMTSLFAGPEPNTKLFAFKNAPKINHAEVLEVRDTQIRSAPSDYCGAYWKGECYVVQMKLLIRADRGKEEEISNLISGVYGSQSDANQGVRSLRSNVKFRGMAFIWNDGSRTHYAPKVEILYTDRIDLSEHLKHSDFRSVSLLYRYMGSYSLSGGGVTELLKKKMNPMTNEEANRIGLIDWAQSWPIHGSDVMELANP